jgi:hypothetical protein
MCCNMWSKLRPAATRIRVRTSFKSDGAGAQAAAPSSTPPPTTSTNPRLLRLLHPPLTSVTCGSQTLTVPHRG